MGKSGNALRAAKAARVKRLFTEEELQIHDRQVIEAFKKNADQHMKKVWDEYDRKQRAEFEERANELWAQRAAEFNSGTPEENMMVMISYLLSVTVRVLIEEFGWTPITGHRFTKRNKLVRFANAVQEELRGIAEDKKRGIPEYAAETDRLYGIRFIMKESE